MLQLFSRCIRGRYARDVFRFRFVSHRTYHLAVLGPRRTQVFPFERFMSLPLTTGRKGRVIAGLKLANVRWLSLLGNLVAAMV